MLRFEIRVQPLARRKDAAADELAGMSHHHHTREANINAGKGETTSATDDSKSNPLDNSDSSIDDNDKPAL